MVMTGLMFSSLLDESAYYIELLVFSLQIATIGLASDENPFGVVLGGIVYVIYLLFLTCMS